MYKLLITCCSWSVTLLSRTWAKLNYFLGIKVLNVSSGFILSQQKYIYINILKRTNMLFAKQSPHLHLHMSSALSLSLLQKYSFAISFYHLPWCCFCCEKRSANSCTDLQQSRVSKTSAEVEYWVVLLANTTAKITCVASVSISRTWCMFQINFLQSCIVIILELPAWF